MGFSYPTGSLTNSPHHTAQEPGERHAMTPPAPRDRTRQPPDYYAFLFERAALALREPSLFATYQREQLIQDLCEAADLIR